MQKKRQTLVGNSELIEKIHHPRKGCAFMVASLPSDCKYVALTSFGILVASMMKKYIQAVKQYYLFFIAFLGTAAALALDLSGLDTLAHWLLIALMAGALLPLLWGMIQDIRSGTYGVDILAATAIITAIIMQEYWAGMVIVLMLTGGESLENYAEHRARKELDALLTRAPEKARIIRGRKEVMIKASEVKVGDKIIIHPGELVPVDARVIDGTSSFDESSLTGESVPVVRETGGVIVSGSVNMDGVITAQTIHVAADSQYEQIIRLVRIASKSKAPFVRLADRYAIPFTIISFGIAGMAWGFSGDSLRFLQVLVVATPCPLILAAPIAIISGMSRAAKHGIIIKTGSALERLATAQTFAFDKTGTLTLGRPIISKLQTYNNYSQTELLRYASALEQRSTHVLAQAIVAAAEKRNIHPPKARYVRELAGNGLTAQVAGKEVLVGRLDLLKEYNITLPKQFHPKEIESTAAFVAINKELAGILLFEDTLREEAKHTLKQLGYEGVKNFLMVTGDNKTVAKRIAKKVGITTVYAEATPGDKIKAIEEAAKRPVAFVGDGVNDAPVLTASDVGIALGARGSTAASESADIVILLDDLGRVAVSRDIAKRTFYIAKQSIFIGIGLSILLMGVFATGNFKPIYGAAIQELVDVVVIFNALRAHGSWKKVRTNA